MWKKNKNSCAKESFIAVIYANGNLSNNLYVRCLAKKKSMMEEHCYDLLGDRSAIIFNLFSSFLHTHSSLLSLNYTSFSFFFSYLHKFVICLPYSNSGSTSCNGRIDGNEQKSDVWP